MDNATRHCLSSYLNEITERYNAEKARLDQLGDHLPKNLRRSGKKMAATIMLWHQMKADTNIWAQAATKM